MPVERKDGWVSIREWLVAIAVLVPLAGSAVIAYGAGAVFKASTDTQLAEHSKKLDKLENLAADVRVLSQKLDDLGLNLGVDLRRAIKK